MSRESNWIRVSNAIKSYFAEIFITLVGLAAVNAAFLAKAFRGATVDAGRAAQLGDFVGGYIGSLLGVVSVVFLFSTLRKQINAAALQEFTDKYYQLIGLHRNNVSEIRIGTDVGRKIFVSLFREFRAIYDVVKKTCDEKGFLTSQRDVLVISYFTLFFGLGPRSSRMLRSALEDYDINVVDEVIDAIGRANVKELRNSYLLKHKPFDGHQSRLGHYYRHLYQTVAFVNKQGLDIDKYDYVKTVRAQLSTHEQVLLLLNALTPLGKNWFTDGLLLKYRLVKNIPKDFFTADEIDMDSIFPKGYFEWEESGEAGVSVQSP